MSKSNKICGAVIAALGICLVISGIGWYRCAARGRDLRISVNNGYDRAFFELTDYVSDIDALLSKARLASDPAQLASVSNEIFMKAAEAKSCFGQLPTENADLEHTAKFLSQVGDYTYVLSRNMINGSKITDDEYDTLCSLNDYAAALSKNLSDIEKRIYAGELSFTTARGDGGAIEAMAAGDGVFRDLENVEKAFDDYPALIYDGPFSEHIENMESYMLKTAPEISKVEALRKAEELLGERGKGLLFESETANTAIEAYNFGRDYADGHITVSITKKGGYVLYFLDTRSADSSEYDIAAASGLAQKFLISRGITDMSSSYYEVTDNVATINFAYAQDGTKCYSDLIKVKVALDDGSIVGMECKGYLMNHRRRDLPAAAISPEQARERVSTRLEVSEVSLAVIPKDSLREVLCYEFKGACAGKNFIIYINAETGREEQILLLIESETGILTI